MKASEEAGNYFAPSGTRKSSTVAQPTLHDVPASQSKTDAAGRVQELPQLMAITGMGTKRQRGSLFPTPSRPSRTPAAPQRATPGHSPQNTAVTCRWPSQRIEEKPTAKESVTLDGRDFALKLPEHNDVPAVSSQGLDGVPRGDRNSIVLPTSRASLAGRPVLQERASKGPLQRKVSFPSRIADLIKVASLSKVSSNDDEVRPGMHHGTEKGHGHGPLALEELEALADRRHLKGQALERLPSVGRPSYCAADVGAASPANKQHALWMQEIGPYSALDEAPRRRVVSFPDGELSLPLKRTAGLCVMVMAVATTLYLVAYFTQQELFRQPSTIVLSDTEPDYFDVNHSMGLLKPKFETKERNTLAETKERNDYGNVGTLRLYTDESAVSGVQPEREVFTEDWEDTTHSAMHHNET